MSNTPKRQDSDAEYKLSESDQESDSEEYTSDDDHNSGGGSPGHGEKPSDASGEQVTSKGKGKKVKSGEQKANSGEKNKTDKTKPRQKKSKKIEEKEEEDGQEKKKKPPKIVVPKPLKKLVATENKQSSEDGSLKPPKGDVKKSPKKKSSPSKASDKENDTAFADDIELLSKLPLPSAAKRHLYNQNISLIGAINIQAFGTKKAGNTVLMRIITDILRRYDIVLCQEIHSQKDEAIIQKLCEQVSTPSTPYAYVTSRPIGRGRYQERYVYLYRVNEWKVLEEFVIDDDLLGDKFAREPYVARFQHVRKPNVKINLVGCHTQPEKAFEEVSALVENVYDLVKAGIKKLVGSNKSKSMLSRDIPDGEHLGLWQTLANMFCCCFPGYSPVPTRDFKESGGHASNEMRADLSPSSEPIIMMGDFNAAGSYVNKKKRAELDALLKKFDLVWGIHNNTDTTVADGSDSAYDRFIFEAANERRWIGNSGVWRFDDGWVEGKEDTTLIKRAAKRVSDHYPIEFELKLS